jgi:hypothetical protein
VNISTIVSSIPIRVESTTSTVLSVHSFIVLGRGCSVWRPGRAVLGSFKFGDYSPLDVLVVSSPFGSVSDADTLLTTQSYIFWRSFFIFLNHLLYSRSRTIYFILYTIGFSPALWKTGCVLYFRHICSFVGESRVSIFSFVSFLNSIRVVRCAAHPGKIVVCSLWPRLPRILWIQFFEHHWSVTRISCWSVFAVFAKMVNLWLRTMDSMNSEEHSEVFVDVND